MEQFISGLQLLGLGMAGVFIVLTVFFLVIRALVALFPVESEQL